MNKKIESLNSEIASANSSLKKTKSELESLIAERDTQLKTLTAEKEKFQGEVSSTEAARKKLEV